MNRGPAILTGIASLLLVGGVVWSSISSASDRGGAFVQAQVPGRGGGYGYDPRGGVYRPAPGGRGGRPGVYGPTVGQRPEFITHLQNIHQGLGLVSQIVGLFGGNTPGSVNYSEIQRLTMEDPQVSLAYDDLRRAEYNLIDQRNAPYVPFWTDYWLSKYEGEQRTALWRYQRALQDAKCRMTNIAQYCTPIPMPGTGSYYR